MSFFNSFSIDTSEVERVAMAQLRMEFGDGQPPVRHSLSATEAAVAKLGADYRAMYVAMADIAAKRLNSKARNSKHSRKDRRRFAAASDLLTASGVQVGRTVPASLVTVG